MSLRVMSRRCICARFRVTRYWRTSPPMGMTWAMPGMVSRRGRITQSTTSRTSMGLASSLATAISMISPMIEVIGAICGLTLRGSCSRTTLSRSVTCWRLR